MFSSEQILKISGEMDQLELTLKFALQMYGGTREYSYQISKDGKYCIGWHVEEEEGWHKFQFDFDEHIVSEIIKQHLNKQKIEDPYGWADGSSDKGFLMKAIPQLFSDEHDGIRHPFYGIVSIEPFMNFYAK